MNELENTNGQELINQDLRIHPYLEDALTHSAKVEEVNQEEEVLSSRIMSDREYREWVKQNEKRMGEEFRQEMMEREGGYLDPHWDWGEEFREWKHRKYGPPTEFNHARGNLGGPGPPPFTGTCGALKKNHNHPHLEDRNNQQLDKLRIEEGELPPVPEIESESLNAAELEAQETAEIMLQGRLLDRVSSGATAEKEAQKQLENHLNKTLSLENKNGEDA